jgi:hypothetical protein
MRGDHHLPGDIRDRAIGFGAVQESAVFEALTNLFIVNEFAINRRLRGTGNIHGSGEGIPHTEAETHRPGTNDFHDDFLFLFILF